MKRLNSKTLAMVCTCTMLATMMSSTAFAGKWQTGSDADAEKWRYIKDDGSAVSNTWQWIDGNADGVAECYYFGTDGWMLASTTTPDNYQVNADGAWTVDGVVQTQAAATSETAKAEASTNFAIQETVLSYENPTSAAKEEEKPTSNETQSATSLVPSSDTKSNSTGTTTSTSNSTSGTKTAVVTVDGPAGKTSGSSSSSVLKSSNSQVVSIARTHLGALTYVSGGNSYSGTDCSGFTKLVFAEIGITLPRTSRQQYTSGTPVPADQIQPGDLVFWSGNGTADGIYHVGIYSGDGNFIHQTNSTRNVAAEDSISNMSDPFGYARY